MKTNFIKLFSAIFSLLFSASSSLNAQAPSDLFISEYVEGSSNNKALEFYNRTASAIDLTAGNYVVQMFFNGSATAGLTISLTGTVPANGVFVLAQSSASFATAPYVNQLNSSGWFNGDDAVVLKKGGALGTILDVIGQVGFDPGTEWGTGLTSTADNTIRRKAADCSGDIDASDVFEPTIKYDGFANDVFTGLGTHSASCVIQLASITLEPTSLNFNTSPGTPSLEKIYTVKGSGLTNDVTITVPASTQFGISKTSGGPYTTSITLTAAEVNEAPVNVYVVFNPSGSGAQSGNISHVSGTISKNLLVEGITSIEGITKIYTIQGAGAASTVDGSIVTTEGVVTADFQAANQLRGFFIQDITGDGNNLTSDGIFVLNSTFDVNVGDYIKVTGEVDEFVTKTEIKNVTSVSVISSGNTLMAPVAINLPVTKTEEMERYEGMLVQFPQSLTVTETFTLGRFGEVALSANGRLYNPTNFIDPNDSPASGTSNAGNNVAEVTSQQNLNDRSRILLDDGSTVQNPAVVPYLNPIDNTLRSGSTLSNLTGVLDFDFSVYRIHPTIVPAFAYAPRPAVPSVGGSNVKVAAFNVLNYFNGDGAGGGFPTERGANTATEFARQRAKIIAAIKELNADVVGLIEMENDGVGTNSALADIVNGINAATAPGTYAYISDPAGANGNPGTDAIKTAIIYKPAIVTPAGLAIADVNAVHNRPPLAQTFTVNANGEKFSVVVVHFKSKGCSDAVGADLDQGDGQSCFNATRKLQALALLDFIKIVQTSSGDADVISVGDYNAYEQEDPMDILIAGGLINVLPSTYSYIFEGQSGSLDHALVTASLNAQLTGAGKWHINADEPIAKDYNQEFNPAYLYSPDPFRSSDHDPLLVGLKLYTPVPPVVTITSPADGATFDAGNKVTIQANASDVGGTIVKVEFYNGATKLGEDFEAPYDFVIDGAEAGTYALTAKAFDNEGYNTVSGVVNITITACIPEGKITLEIFEKIKGASITDLTNHPNFPNNPGVVTQIDKLEYSKIANHYGARIRGYICAPLSGNYTFYISSDDASELWLSSDANPANKIKIAYSNTPVAKGAWNVNPSQVSAPVFLVKGARYYIEVLHKEDNNHDHLAVRWVMPDGTIEAPIAANRLSPWQSPTPAARLYVKTGIEKNLAEGLSVSATPNPSSTNFTLRTNSNGNEALTITVTDAVGRVVEQRSKVPATGIIQLGDRYPKGLYFIEIRQGKTVKALKLSKQ